jgi:hypothetical protein
MPGRNIDRPVKKSRTHFVNILLESVYAIVFYAYLVCRESHLMNNAPLSSGNQSTMIFCAVTHLGLGLIAQLVSYVAYVRPLSLESLSPALFAGRFVVVQLDGLVVALALGVLGLVCTGSLAGRALFYVVVVLANIAVLFNQLVYHVFYEPFSVFLIEAAGSLAAFINLVVAQLDWGFIVTLIACVVITVGQFRCIFGHRCPLVLPASSWSNALLRPRNQVGLVVVLAVSVAGFVNLSLYNLNRHPLLSLLREQVIFADALISSPRVVNVYQTRFGDNGEPHNKSGIIYTLDRRQETWSLQDGRWLYRANIAGSAQRLFDTRDDPQRQANRIADLPARGRYYDQLLAAWYTRYGYENGVLPRYFVKVNGQWRRPQDTGLPGPKRARFGIYTGRDEISDFAAYGQFNPYDAVVAQTRWVPYDTDVPVVFVWQGPDGFVSRFPFMVKRGWDFTHVAPGFGLPMVTGTWQMRIEYGNQVLLARDFEVSGQAPLKQPFATTSRAVTDIAVGVFRGSSRSGERQFVAATNLAPQDHPVVEAHWGPGQGTRKIVYRWTRPDGQVFTREFGLRQAWEKSWYELDAGKPLQAGSWTVSLWQNEQKLAETAFTVFAQEGGSPQ